MESIEKGMVQKHHMFSPYMESKKRNTNDGKEVEYLGRGDVRKSSREGGYNQSLLYACMQLSH